MENKIISLEIISTDNINPISKYKFDQVFGFKEKFILCRYPDPKLNRQFSLLIKTEYLILIFFHHQ